MSDSELEELVANTWFDSESDLTEVSTIDIAPVKSLSYNKIPWP